MAFVYSVDGVSLADPAGRWWVTAEGSSHSPALAIRSVNNQVPGMNGVPDFGRVTREASSLNLRVMTRSRDAAMREAYWEAVKALFTTADTFTVGRAIDGVERTTLGKLKSISEPELGARTGTLVGVIGVNILDGLFHGRTHDITREFNSDFTGFALAAVCGTAATEDWALRIKGPLASFESTDDASSTGIGWSGALTSTQYLFINGVSARVSASLTAWKSGGTDASGGVTVPAAGLLALTPRPLAGDPMNRVARWSATRAGSSAATEITARVGPSFV